MSKKTSRGKCPFKRNARYRDEFVKPGPTPGKYLSNVMGRYGHKGYAMGVRVVDTDFDIYFGDVRIGIRLDPNSFEFTEHELAARNRLFVLPQEPSVEWMEALRRLALVRGIPLTVVHNGMATGFSYFERP